MAFGHYLSMINDPNTINIESVIVMLAKYDSDLNDIDDRIKIEGKTLVQSNHEQPGLMTFYDQRRIELASLLSAIQLILDEKTAKIWKQLTENTNLKLQQSDKKYYLSLSQDYMQFKKVELLITEVLDKYKMVCDALSARGYALRNITNLRVAAMEDADI